jgi:hypothetical protein
VDENEILVTCIGETMVAHLGRENIKRMSIELLPRMGEARVLLTPVSDDLQMHLTLLDRFADVEDIFVTDATLSIRLVPAHAPDFDAIGARELAFTA